MKKTESILPLLAILMDQSTSNVTVYTKRNIIDILLGAVRQTLRQTHQDSRPNKVNLAYIASSTLIIRVIIKLTLLIVSSGNITSINNNIPRNTKSFVKIEANQSA